MPLESVPMKFVLEEIIDLAPLGAADHRRALAERDAVADVAGDNVAPLPELCRRSYYCQN